MLIQVNPNAEEPLFVQIAQGIRREIAVGAAPAGTRLPAARDLAKQLDVNLHTVLKAYQALRDEGLVELRRGRGAVVTSQANSFEGLVTAVDQLICRAEALGVDVEAAISLLRARADRS